ncbi:MAG: Rieske 2Fe-2S domain-containing protein [Candidatus Marsarchaeota archaeon]|nr:Rieske 2Fe-2S domain-containing protein [Candidatus Marsarchaeota archaeon]
MANVKLNIKKAELKEGKQVKVTANGKDVLLALINGEIYAIDDICSHRGGPLHKGLLDGFNIKCPWHGAIFDVRTGNVDPATTWGKHQQKYEVRIDDNGEISIDM